jgi:hypothetical protein
VHICTYKIPYERHIQAGLQNFSVTLMHKVLGHPRDRWWRS